MKAIEESSSKTELTFNYPELVANEYFAKVYVGNYGYIKN